MSELLKQYAELQLQALDIQAKLSDIEAAIRAEVDTSGIIAGHGFVAKYKLGRKSTDHEAAYKDEYKALAFDSDRAEFDEIVKRYSTTKTTIAWAKVTKQLELDLEPYTTEGAPQFVIEVVK